MNIFRKIILILTSSERRSAIFLVFLTLMGIIFETLSIGLIVPVISVLVNENVTNYLHFFPLFLSDWASRFSNTNLVIAVLLLMALVYATKALYLCFLSWFQTIFAYRVQSRVSRSLLSSYLAQPYTFHLERNSAQLIANVSNLPSFLASCIIHGSSLFTEALLVFAIFVLLMKVDFSGTLVAGLSLGLFSFGLYKVVTRHSVSAGKKFQIYEGLRIKRIQQALGGVKEIIVLGRAQTFIDDYYHENQAGNKIASHQVIVQNIPRLILESVAVIGLIGLIVSMVLGGKPPAYIIATVGIFAVAAFRLMPSATRIINAFQALRYHGSNIPELYAELFSLSDFSDRRDTNLSLGMPFKSNVVLKSVSYVYPGSAKNALEDVNLTINKGDSIGIIGQSGSGKSTFVDLLLGLITPTEGSFIVDGHDIRESISTWQRQIGYVPQSIYLADESLLQNIAFGVPPHLISESMVWEALEAAQLAEFARALPLGLNTQIGERGVRLSGGQRQRIGVARALYHEPEILILDEATSALDTETEKGVMESIYKLHGLKTLVIIAHRLTTVSNCDHIYRFEQGVIVESGVPTAILKSNY